MSRACVRVRALGATLCGLALIACGGGGGGGGGGLAGNGSSGAGGGGGGGTSAPNIAPITVSAGPSGSALDTIYTSVTVCVPGTSTCQTIDNIQVDTGSYGLRLLASVVTLNLPVSMQNGASLLECTPFLDGYSWGPVALVDLTVGGEKAASLPVQVIGASGFPAAPSECAQASGNPNNPEDTVAQFGANGLLGVGPFAQDCGSACANSTIPATYYTCTASSCAQAAVALSAQVQNPVRLFASDNNGVIIQLPSVPLSGAASASGSLIFGVDTESNNQLGSDTVLALANASSSNPLPGDLYTTFNGSQQEAFIDSGSNAIYFNDASIATCASPNQSFYCPASAVTLSATLQAASGGASIGASFTVGNLDTLLTSNGSYAAFPDIAGTLSPGGNSGSFGSFDWGVPFFFNRAVAYVIDGASSSAGTGPLVAF